MSRKLPAIQTRDMKKDYFVTVTSTPRGAKKYTEKSLIVRTDNALAAGEKVLHLIDHWQRQNPKDNWKICDIRRI